MIDRIYRIDITRAAVNVQPQDICTSDGFDANIDVQVYFKVRTDTENDQVPQTSINELKLRVVRLTKTVLCNLIALRTQEATAHEHEKIKKRLHKTLSKETGTWGIEIVRIELKTVDLPQK